MSIKYTYSVVQEVLGLPIRESWGNMHVHLSPAFFLSLGAQHQTTTGKTSNPFLRKMEKSSENKNKTRESKQLITKKNWNETQKRATGARGLKV